MNVRRSFGVLRIYQELTNCYFLTQLPWRIAEISPRPG